MTTSGREDLDQIVKISSLQPGEPFFFVRGHDPHSGPTARFWARMAHASGVDPAVIEQALRQADTLDAFRPKKLTDAEHLTSDERAQLSYQLSRRAWNAREADDIVGASLVLAERRGYDLAAGRARRGEPL